MAPDGGVDASLLTVSDRSACHAGAVHGLLTDVAVLTGTVAEVSVRMTAVGDAGFTHLTPSGPFQTHGFPEHAATTLVVDTRVVVSTQIIVFLKILIRYDIMKISS